MAKASSSYSHLGQGKVHFHSMRRSLACYYSCGASPYEGTSSISIYVDKSSSSGNELDDDGVWKFTAVKASSLRRRLEEKKKEAVENASSSKGREDL